MKLLGDPGYRMLSVAMAIGAVALAVPIVVAALAFMTDDWLYANFPNYHK